MRADNLSKYERRGRFWWTLPIFMGPPVAFAIKLAFEIYFVPSHSAQHHLEENQTTVVANYYSGLTAPAGQHIIVERNGRKVTLRFNNGDWLSASRIDVYLTTERHIGLRGADPRWFMIDPLTSKVTTSALPDILQWTYVGSFDFAGPPRKGNFKFLRSTSTQSSE